MTPVPPSPRKRPTRPRLIGLLALIVFGIVPLLIGVLAIAGLFIPDAANLLGSIGASLYGMPAPQTRDLPGDARAFDPLANYDLVLAFAGEGVMLTELDSYYVKPDGTLDLLADYGAWVHYEFIRTTNPPQTAPPIGAGGSDGQWYEVLSVQATRPGRGMVTSRSGGGGRVTLRWVSKGLSLEIDDPTTRVEPIAEAPRCPFREFWAYALELGAPQNAVATIRYSAGGYNFLIAETPYNYDFTPDCELE